MEENKLKGIFADKKKFFTKNLVPGSQVYGETIFKEKGEEYRYWDPSRSKLGAALAKGISQLGLKPDSVVLYLGAATGTTVSHVSDLVGSKGFVFALDSSARVLRQLVFVAEERKNISPILADANMPYSYVHLVPEVDFIFQDVAQRNQIDIFLKNIELYLKKGGFAAIAVKARSVDVTKKPKEIFENARKELEKKITVVDHRTLEPYEKDHAFFVCKKQ
ncbi:fibrillarin-like rRNA/tRNA 2'-O-methyltransferase [Candidatus Woesearchaeota archaeon]|nr:fibrillarin-like rRNA/tRNA 2'-O-methyltransferase [Candidatus Woesearchaeota archaeon]